MVCLLAPGWWFGSGLLPLSSGYDNSPERLLNSGPGETGLLTSGNSVAAKEKVGELNHQGRHTEVTRTEDILVGTPWNRCPRPVEREFKCSALGASLVARDRGVPLSLPPGVPCLLNDRHQGQNSKPSLVWRGPLASSGEYTPRQNLGSVYKFEAAASPEDTRGGPCLKIQASPRETEEHGGGTRVQAEEEVNMPVMVVPVTSPVAVGRQVTVMSMFPVGITFSMPLAVIIPVMLPPGMAALITVTVF